MGAGIIGLPQGRSFVMRSLNPCPENFDQIVVVWWGWGGWGVNDQTQIVNTKLPNENIQTYQLQIVIKLPNGATKVTQNDLEQPILPNSQLFQSFPTEVAQNDLERPNLPDLQLFQSFPTKVVLKMTLNSQFSVIHNFSDLFPLKWLRMTQNGQFHPIHNFANLSPPEWLRMTQNGQFCLICNFSNLFPPNAQFWGGRGVNDQMQIVNTKLPNKKPKPTNHK